LNFTYKCDRREYSTKKCMYGNRWMPNLSNFFGIKNWFSMLWWKSWVKANKKLDRVQQEKYIFVDKNKWYSFIQIDRVNWYNIN